MTEVAFHFNVPDKTQYLCRLLRKVVAAGKRALVLLPEPQARAVDQALWTFSQEDFLSHATEQDSLAVQRRSAIVLASRMCDVAHSQVLINCLEDVPSGFERFERLLELVGNEDVERAQARMRWRTYVQQGYELIRHDVAQLAR